MCKTRLYKYLISFILTFSFLFSQGQSGYTSNGGFNGSESSSINETGNGNSNRKTLRNTDWDNFEFNCTQWKGSTTQGNVGCIVFRWTGTGSYYALTQERDQGKFRLKKNNAHSANGTGGLGYYDGPNNQNPSIKIICVGSSIKVWIDGTLQFDVTDYTHSGGQFGFYKSGRWNDGNKWYGVSWVEVAGCTNPTVTMATTGNRCNTGTVDIQATASAGNINWYDASSGGSSIGTSNSGVNWTTPSISSTTIYYAEAVDGSCNSTSRTAVVATVNTVITGSSGASRSGAGTLDLSATSTSGDIKWYADPTGGSEIATTSSGATWTTPSISSTTIYYVEADNGSCTSSSRTAVTATVTNPPGGVGSNLHLWLKADAQAHSSGTTLATDGQPIDNWKDQSGNNLNADDSDGTGPDWDADAINYNPALDFTGGATGQPLDIPNGILEGGTKTVLYVYSVFATDLEQTQALFYQQTNVSSSNWHYTFIPHWSNGSIYYDHGTNSTGRITNTSGITLGQPHLFSLKSDGADMEIKRDGTSIGTSTQNGTSTEVTNYPFYIGTRYNNSGNYWDGKLAELIIYDGVPSSSDEDKIESYLALKYGITLASANYLSSDGTVIWDDHASYNQDIAGIGRDDNSGLDQKQSKSINPDAMMTMSLGAIAANNTANSSSFSNNNSFIMWAHENSAISGAGITDVGITTNYDIVSRRIGRKWLIKETGTVGSVRIQIDASNIPGNSGVGTNDLAYVRLLVSSGGAFATGATSISPTSYNNVTNLAQFDYNFASNSDNYISVGSVDYLNASLPVELLSFTAVSTGEIVVLDWKTASEINNDYFVIEKSMDGITWDFVLQIPGAGNSDTQLSYNHIDYTGCEGHCYYRLTQVDYDGVQKKYKAVVINNNKNIYDISVTPNPIQTEAHVNCQFPKDGTYTFRIISSTGQSVYEAKVIGAKGSNTFTCKTDQYLPGIYYYTITNSEGHIVQQRSIKN